MQPNLIFSYVLIVLRELNQRKFKVALAVAIISFVVLFMGMLRPSNFQSSVTIFADNQNIIKPLLAKSTSVTNVKQNRTTQVQDIIYSPRILTQVIKRVYGESTFPSQELIDAKILQLRKKIRVEGLSGNYIKISFSDDTADATFRILNEVVVMFIEDSANTKRDESRSAYNFIEQQVDSYKQQLLLSESKLKAFQSNNLDGTDTEVNNRIATLRATIEEMKIQVQESNTRVWSIKKQLDGEDKFANNDYESAVYHTQLKNLEQQKANLLLTYQDDYPEVVELNYQINDLKQTILALSNNPKNTSELNSEFNPLYKELRSKLSDANVENRTLKNRLSSFESLLEEAYERRKRIANNQAELSELTRDYNVIKAQYDEMLTTKEKARLSMVLDIEGQGVNYKIQEPAAYPNAPKGIRFIHFFLLGPFIGLLIIAGIFTARVLLDGKIRLTSQFEYLEDINVLGQVKRTISKSEKLKNRLSNIYLLMFTFLIGLAYVAVALAHKYDLSIGHFLDLGSLKNAIL